MKFLATVAAAATLAFAATASAQIDTTDATIPFAQEPEAYAEDATVAFVDQPEYLDANETQALTFDDATDNANANAVTESEGEDQRRLAVGAVVVAGLQIAAAAAPIVADIIKGQRKECQQVACWIATERTCGLAVAEKVQRDMMMGRDRYRYESIQNNGMWVRYWRTKFEPADRGVIASGKCSNGRRFEVTNCQSTGQVHC